MTVVAILSRVSLRGAVLLLGLAASLGVWYAIGRAFA